MPALRSIPRPFALLALCLSLLASGSFSACSSGKTGCPSTQEATKGTTNKKGELTTKRGKSNLFPKKMR